MDLISRQSPPFVLIGIVVRTWINVAEYSSLTKGMGGIFDRWMSRRWESTSTVVASWGRGPRVFAEPSSTNSWACPPRPDIGISRHHLQCRPKFPYLN